MESVDRALSRGQGVPRVSIVVPLWNERDNVRPLCAALREALSGWEETWEALLVDDGSTDGTADLLVAEASADPRLRIFRLRRNSGQTHAMAAGFRSARGSIIVTMDGDLQNDPADIPRLVARLREGADVVCGWRRARRDAWISRTLPSRAANWIVRKVTGVRVHDTGCSLKAYRAEIPRSMNLYAEMHRFLPAIAAMSGARIEETIVRHHPRRHGRSKYGLERVGKVAADIQTIYCITQFSMRPGVWFILMALPWIGLGALTAGVWLFRVWVLRAGASIVYPSLSVIFFYLAGHFFSLAVLAEMLLARADRRPLQRLTEILATVEERPAS